MRPLQTARLILALAAFVCGGCTGMGGIRPERPNRIELTEETLQALEGTYALYGEQVSSYGRRCEECRAYALFEERVLSPLAERVSESETLGDSARTAYFRVVGPNRIEVTTYADDRPVERWQLKGRVNGDGYFVLDTDWQVRGTFPLLWGLVAVEAAIGLDNSGDLLVDSDVGGLALLIVLPIGGANAPVHYTFPRFDE